MANRINGFVQGLYDMAAGVPDENGIPKMDEQKLRRELEKNNQLGRRNKEVFREKEVKFTTCPRYNPCPICDKCQNKASHLYVACQTCKINICNHTYDNRNTMIKRRNFVEYVNKETMDYIKNLSEQVKGGNQDD